MNWFEAGPFTVFDLETTGLCPSRDRIVQIGALRIDLDGKVSKYVSLVNPRRKIPPMVSKITHITDDMVAEAPDFAQVASEFIPFAANTTLVAHNARFDLGFLQESLCRVGLPLWNGRTLDTLRLCKTLYPGLPTYKLQSLRTFFGLQGNMQAHRADSDVEWTMQLLHKLLNIAMEKNQ